MNNTVSATEPQHYAALIRAHECTPILVDLIATLRAQTAPPQSIIIVDSSHKPATARAFEQLGAVVVTYPLEPFNFSKALNIGIAANALPMTLIISSHMQILQTDVIEKGIGTLKDGTDIAYWAQIEDQRKDLPHEFRSEISLQTFTGSNGISNSMALIPTALARNRSFREEVFSAEDQEWTKYYLKTFHRPITRIDTRSVIYKNPQHSGGTWSELKVLNEELAIGHFVNRRLLMPDRIFLRFSRGVLALLRGRGTNAKKHFHFAWALTCANFVQPRRQSKYF